MNLYDPDREDYADMRYQQSIYNRRYKQWLQNNSLDYRDPEYESEETKPEEPEYTD